MELSCQVIQERYSCRSFEPRRDVPPEIVEKLIYAASLAPSGKNLQPWKFKIINDEHFGNFLFELLPNNKWVRLNRQFIAVFLDTSRSYHAIKDSMAIGAAIENLLIEAQSNQVNSCWIGECTEYDQEIGDYLKIDAHNRLLAIIAIGYSTQNKNAVNKRPIQSLLI